MTMTQTFSDLDLMTRAIIGAAVEVHRVTGLGLLRVC